MIRFWTASVQARANEQCIPGLGFALMNIKSLLIVTALVEVGTGIALLVAPSVTVELLLGAGLASLQSLLLGRVAGAALISIGVTCWLAREGESTTQTALVPALLIYNVAVPVLLIYAAIAFELRGILVWPASISHVILAIWCVTCLRGMQENKHL